MEKRSEGCNFCNVPLYIEVQQTAQPILGPFDWVSGLNHIELPEWIITWSETGNRKNKVKPKKDWLGGIVNGYAEHHIHLLIKESLRVLMGKDFRQEFTWEEEGWLIKITKRTYWKGTNDSELMQK